jgi:3-keto-L-gulonate-6-phosphate decarboxylase
MDRHVYETVGDAIAVAAGVRSARDDLELRGPGNAIVADLRTTPHGVELLAVTVRPVVDVVTIIGTDFLTTGNLTQHIV